MHCTYYREESISLPHLLAVPVHMYTRRRRPDRRTVAINGGRPRTLCAYVLRRQYYYSTAANTHNHTGNTILGHDDWSWVLGAMPLLKLDY